MQETQVRSLGWEDPLEKEMATHSSILAWRIPGTEEPVRLQSMGSQRVRHHWATSLTYLLTYLLASAFIVNPLKWSLFYLFYTHGPPESIQLCYKDSHVPIVQWSKPKQHSPRVNSVALGLPWWLSDKESTCQHRRYGFDPWSWKIHMPQRN